MPYPLLELKDTATLMHICVSNEAFYRPSANTPFCLPSLLPVYQDCDLSIRLPVTSLVSLCILRNDAYLYTRDDDTSGLMTGSW